MRHLLSSNRSNRFFSCDLVPNATQGYYSSGEESKVNFLLSLYDALEKIRERKSEEDSRNIILLLDEVDAYFHPQYQIELINELLGIISKVFEGFYVQIILTSNTPIVLSDIPAANITYLENRKVHEEQNSVESFGSNIHILMKNKFYINTSMGVFAKKKIDNVIRFLSDQDSLCKSKEEAKYIISVIGEPIIKEKLQQMYYYKFPEDIPNQNEKIKFYKKRVDELQKYILWLMIELPYFKEENWYLEMIKKVLVDARFKDENKRRTAYANKLENINQLIAEIVDETYFSSEYEEYTLFEKLVLAPYSDLEKIYRKIYNNADDIFLKEIVDKNGDRKKVIKEKWKIFYKLYDKLIDKGINQQLIQKYGIKCCPYCNENFIVNRKRKMEKNIRWLS